MGVVRRRVVQIVVLGRWKFRANLGQKVGLDF